MMGCMGTNVKINLWYARCSCPAGKWRCNIPAPGAKGLFQVLSASDIDMSTCWKDNPCAAAVEISPPSQPVLIQHQRNVPRVVKIGYP